MKYYFFYWIGLFLLTKVPVFAQTALEYRFTYQVNPLPVNTLKISQKELAYFEDYFYRIPAKVDSTSRLYRKDKVVLSLFEEKINVRVLRHSLEQLQKIYVSNLHRPSVTSCNSELFVINNIKYLFIRYTEYNDEFIMYRSDMNKSFVRIEDR